MRRLILMAVLLLSFGFMIGLRPAAAAGGAGDVVVQTVPGQTVAQKLGTRAEASWPWYLTRASGLVAAAALVILMLSGIGQITGHSFKFLDPLTAWASHRALGITFGVSVLVHIFSLLFDKFVSFNIFQLLVPWLSNYSQAKVFGLHLGSLWVALGIFAFYLSAVVVITSLVWVEKKPHLWRLLHFLSYLIILLVFIHALYLGTDLTHGLLRALWWLAGLTIAAGVLVRLWRARTI